MKRTVIGVELDAESASIKLSVNTPLGRVQTAVTIPRPIHLNGNSTGQSWSILDVEAEEQISLIKIRR